MARGSDRVVHLWLGGGGCLEGGQWSVLVIARLSWTWEVMVVVPLGGQ